MILKLNFVVCPVCGGNGNEEGFADRDAEACVECGGDGQIPAQSRKPRNKMTRAENLDWLCYEATKEAAAAEVMLAGKSGSSVEATGMYWQMSAERIAREIAAL